MRKNNPKRYTRPERCGCEALGCGHPHGRRLAGDTWGMYVGHICDDCAATCMKDWIIKDHVHGEGDCRRTPPVYNIPA